MHAQEGGSMCNIRIQNKGGLLYRHYKDRRRHTLDQVVVLEKYQAGILTMPWKWLVRSSKDKQSNRETFVRILRTKVLYGCGKSCEVLQHMSNKLGSRR